MSPDNTKALIDTYPELFSGLHPQKCMYLFGFECGDGWFDLLKECIQKIKDIAEKNKLQDLKAAQIKEKYGVLRFYLDWTTDEIDHAILQAEDKSAITCERCGTPGELRRLNGYWYVTYCDECYNKANQ